MDDISVLRSEIDGIDEHILRLVSERFKIVEEIGALKKLERKQIYDKSREDFLSKRWAKIAKKYNVDNAMTGKLLKMLLEEAKTLEYKKNGSENVVIIGTGSMAEAMGRLAIEGGSSVFIAGRDPEKVRRLCRKISARRFEGTVKKADYAIVCVPPEAMSSALAAYGPKGAKAIMEISSSKNWDMKALEKESIKLGSELVSLHPLFGLENAKRGARIAAIKKNCKGYFMAVEFWRSKGLDVIPMTKEHHEKAMAVSQVLRHLYALGFYDSAMKLSKRLGVDCRRETTAKFSEMLQNASSIKSEEWVAKEIAEKNPYSHIVYDVAREELLSRIKAQGF